MAFKVPEGTTRLNAYVKNELNEKMEAYISENMLSKTGFINLVLKQFFDGQEAMKSMSNLTDLMKLLADKTGVDLSKIGNQTGADA